MAVTGIAPKPPRSAAVTRGNDACAKASWWCRRRSRVPDCAVPGGWEGSGGCSVSVRVVGASLLGALLLASTAIVPASAHGPESRPMLGNDAHAEAGPTVEAAAVPADSPT